jgi:hypothetical protein
MRRAAALAAVAPIALAPVLAAAPAHADGELGLSRDGVHWHERLVRPLFDPDIRWVPGDVRTARFYVRNLAPDAGTLSVDVERVRRRALADSGFLHVVARADGAPWTALADGDLARLIDGDDLASGRTIPVDVRVALGAAAPNETMVLSSDLDFRVTLRDADAVSSNGAVPRDGTVLQDGLRLPATGAVVPPWLPPTGVALVAVGLWLLAGRRRRCDDLEERLPRA